MPYYRTTALVLEYKGNNTHRRIELHTPVEKPIKFDVLLEKMRAALHLQAYDACTILSEEYVEGEMPENENA